MKFVNVFSLESFQLYSSKAIAMDFEGIDWPIRYWGMSSVVRLDLLLVFSSFI